MLRVRSSYLVPDEASRLRYREAPFSGLAYDVGDDGVLRAIAAVEGGRITGESSDWIELPAGGVRVDWELLEQPEDYGPQLFLGAPFTGVAYFFERSGACVAEVEHVHGYATEVSQREWYEEGEPREVIGGGEYTSWFQDGRLKRRATGGVVVYNLITRDDDGRLAGIVLRDPSLFDLAAVSAMTLSDDLMLLGGGVDSALLRDLRDHGGLSATRRLRLIETGIGPEGVGVIASLGNLAELWLEDNPRFGPAEARQVEALRPDCKVHLEAVRAF